MSRRLGGGDSNMERGGRKLERRNTSRDLSSDERGPPVSSSNSKIGGNVKITKKDSADEVTGGSFKFKDGKLVEEELTSPNTAKANEGKKAAKKRRAALRRANSAQVLSQEAWD